MDLDELDDAIAADAFRRLVLHLRHRTDAQNIDLMGLAGFCRNCLADWLSEASTDGPTPINQDEGRALIYGMPFADWKHRFQVPATEEQLARMASSVARNQR